MVGKSQDSLMVNPTWLVVSNHLKNMSQNENLPQIGVKIKKYLKPPPSHLFNKPNFWQITFHPYSTQNSRFQSTYLFSKNQFTTSNVSFRECRFKFPVRESSITKDLAKLPQFHTIPKTEWRGFLGVIPLLKNTHFATEG